MNDSKHSAVSPGVGEFVPTLQLTNPLEPTVFHEPWWLEVATQGNYKLAEAETGGKIVGRMPYSIQRRFGISSIEMPMLTHFLGPGLIEGEGSSNARFLRRLAITRELIQKLPAVSLIRIKMHYGITDTVPFQEQGFRTSVQFTHEVSPLQPEVLWKNLRNKTRNVIRRSEEQVQVLDLTAPDEFMAFYLHNLSARNARSFLNQSVCQRLIAAAIERNRGRIIAAYDDAKKLLAANFYVWDQRSYYYLLTTRDTNSGNGATSLLLWEAIKDAAGRGLIFDSDGLNSTGSILFFAGLGGAVKPRYIVSKANLKGGVLDHFHDAVWGKNYFVNG